MYQLGLSGIDDGLGRLTAASGSCSYDGANGLTRSTGRSTVTAPADPTTRWTASAALAAIYETACLRRVGVLEGAETALRRGLVDIALCWVKSDADLRRSEAAALVWDDIARWDNGSGRLTVRRSKTDTTPRTVYLTPVAMAHLDAIRSEPVFGLSVASISRRVKAAARTAGLGPVFQGIPGGSAWRGAWPGPARPRMRLWHRDAGAAPAWSPTTPAPKTPNAPPSGWGDAAVS